MSMFGLIASGRMVQTDFQPISETQFVITIPDADNINHIVIFLTGVLPFPEGTAGQVFFSWPDPTAPPNWQPLGHISNIKPSAIFKVSNFKRLEDMNSTNVMFGQSHIVHNAQIGISIENVNNIQEVIPANNPLNNLTFAQKMLENFMNFIMSFSVNQNQVVQQPNATYIPLASVQQWYTNFERRLQNNPNFWKS